MEWLRDAKVGKDDPTCWIYDDYDKWSEDAIKEGANPDCVLIIDTTTCAMTTEDTEVGEWDKEIGKGYIWPLSNECVNCGCERDHQNCEDLLTEDET